MGSDRGGFKSGSSTGVSELSFDKLTEIKTDYVSDAVTGNVPLSSKGKTGETTVI